MAFWACRRSGKGQKKKEIARGIKFLREFLTAEPLDWNKNCNLYCWYYYTQVFFQAGGDDWKFYNEQFLPQILPAQKPGRFIQTGPRKHAVRWCCR